MQYNQHTFSKIKFKNPRDDVPELTFEYTALAEDDSLKEATDTFPGEIPHQPFLDAWEKLIRFWKLHISSILGTVEWDLNRARVTTLKIYYESSQISALRYWVTVNTIDDKSLTISTPKVAVSEEEQKLIKMICEESVAFVEGARGEGDLFAEDEISDYRKN